MNKKKFTLVLAIALCGTFSAQAKVWRINNTPGVAADFTSLSAAHASASVLNDDTLYVEGSVTPYSGLTLSKRLVIIGTGYFLNGANSNPGLQANPESCTLNGAISFDSTGSGSVLMGLDNLALLVGSSLGSATDNITVTRCRLNYLGLNFGYTPNTAMTGWKVTKCYFYSSGISFGGFLLQNWEITNNIFESSIDISSPTNQNILVRNNVFRTTINVSNCYFANNLITSNTFITLNTTVKNNISTGNNLPAGNGNQNNQLDGIVFQGITGNSTDGQWRLKAGSPAIGAGETVSGITPDCGAYGTADPYRVSGIPAIPTIYSLTVPSTVASNATSMSITISTKSNN